MMRRLCQDYCPHRCTAVGCHLQIRSHILLRHQSINNKIDKYLRGGNNQSVCLYGCTASTPNGNSCRNTHISCSWQGAAGQSSNCLWETKKLQIVPQVFKHQTGPNLAGGPPFLTSTISLCSWTEKLRCFETHQRHASRPKLVYVDFHETKQSLLSFFSEVTGDLNKNYEYRDLERNVGPSESGQQGQSTGTQCPSCWSPSLFASTTFAASKTATLSKSITCRANKLSLGIECKKHSCQERVGSELTSWSQISHDIKFLLQIDDRKGPKVVLELFEGSIFMKTDDSGASDRRDLWWGSMGHISGTCAKNLLHYACSPTPEW